MSGPDTVDLSDYYHPGEMRTSRSAGGDVADRNSGNIVRVVVDTGKAWIWSVICGISIAVNLVMYFEMRELKDEARISRNHWSNIEVDVETLKRVVK